MVDLDEMAEEHDRMLRELAELGMAFAHELKAQVKTVRSVAEADALALAFYRVQRGVRLTLALRSRLAREHLELGKLQRDATVKAAERRKAQIRAVLEPEIFTEDADQQDADRLRERLVERLDDDALFDEFLTAPFETAVARIRKDLGLPDVPLTSPIADGGRGTAGRAQRRTGGGGGEPQSQCAPLAPSTIRSPADGPRPAAEAGEVRKKPAPT